MPISNRIVQHCSALTNRTLPVTARIQPFSISASTLDEKKAKEQEPRSVTHNYFESLKDYDEEQNASYEKDRVAGSFWGGDPGQVKQPGDENEAIDEKSPNVHESRKKTSKSEKNSVRGVKK
ncbi:unnamed protein product [Umbelopsis vinacea]